MARNPDRIPELLDLLKAEWEASPDLRFFQLVENLKAQHGYGEFAHIATEDSTLIRDMRDSST